MRSHVLVALIGIAVRELTMKRHLYCREIEELQTM